MKFKKLIAVFITVVTILSCFSFSAFAEEGSSGKYLKIPTLVNETLSESTDLSSGAQFLSFSVGAASFKIGFGKKVSSTGMPYVFYIYLKDLIVPASSTEGNDISIKVFERNIGPAKGLYYDADIASVVNASAFNIGYRSSVEKNEANYIEPGKTYSLVMGRYKDGAYYSEQIDISLNVHSDVLSKNYDNYYVYYVPTQKGAYLEVLGKDRTAEDKNVQYTIQANIMTAKSYESETLPTFSEIRDLPAGLKATKYYVINKDGNKTYYAPGDIPISDASYLIEVEMDLSNPTQIIQAFVNYIIWVICLPFYNLQFH